MLLLFSGSGLHSRTNASAVGVPRFWRYSWWVHPAAHVQARIQASFIWDPHRSAGRIDQRRFDHGPNCWTRSTTGFS